MLVRPQRADNRRLSPCAVDLQTDHRLCDPGAKITEEEPRIGRLYVEPLPDRTDVRAHSGSVDRVRERDLRSGQGASGPGDRFADSGYRPELRRLRGESMAPNDDH